MENKLEIIKKACVAANPSIKNLPEYPYNPDAAKAIIALENVAGKTLWNNDIEVTARNMILNYESQRASDYRAMLEERYLGRKIGLADVLCALNFAKKDFMGDWHINTRGHFCKWLINGQNISQAETWNLIKDDLTQQSPETIDFLAELLK